MKLYFRGITILLLTVSSFSQDFQGDWQASVQESGKAMQYVLHIKRFQSGFSATVDEPASFSFGNTVDAISVNHSTMQVRNGQIVYDGSLSADSQSIKEPGLWAEISNP